MQCCRQTEQCKTRRHSKTTKKPLTDKGCWKQMEQCKTQRHLTTTKKPLTDKGCWRRCATAGRRGERAAHSLPNPCTDLKSAGTTNSLFLLELAHLSSLLHASLHLKPQCKRLMHLTYVRDKQQGSLEAGRGNAPSGNGGTPGGGCPGEGAAPAFPAPFYSDAYLASVSQCVGF
jgi:hypothetical protein